MGPEHALGHGISHVTSRPEHMGAWASAQLQRLTVSARVVAVINSCETAAITLERLFSMVTSVILGSKLYPL